MRVYTRVSLVEFEFWSGAQEVAELLTNNEMSSVEAVLCEMYPNGMSENELNDLFRFEEDQIANWLGYRSFGQIRRERGSSGEEEDDESEQV